MTTKPNTLKNNENEEKAGASKQFEVHPNFLRKLKCDVKI
jgi:hypothetical protein